MKPLTPTPTNSQIPLRTAEFSNLAEALDYAATGSTGFNFYNGRGELREVLTFAALRHEAIQLAKRLNSLQLTRGARVAIVAETHPEFLKFFFACQYAGYVPVPLPASIHLGGKKAYIDQLKGLLIKSQAAIAVASDDFLAYIQEAAIGLGLRLVGSSETFDNLPLLSEKLLPLQVEEIAYLQYTSGSTRFPRGVMVSQATLMHNLAGITRDGLKVSRGDRCVSWLPYYHDMGLVGFVLAPLASQLSVDYLSTRDFAMRPRLWLHLISNNRGTLSFGPPFGYELCTRRIRDDEKGLFDLSSWRVAGVGAETIRPDVLDAFADKLGSSKFNRKAFLPSYGMAECSLAISFAKLGQGMIVDEIDAESLTEQQIAMPINSSAMDSKPLRIKRLVNCGSPLPGHEVRVLDEQRKPLPDRRCGIIHVRGPSVMEGYFGDPDATAEALSEDGWLNTGDIGYLDKGSLVITGRQKDMIIINGRNIWPQDLEYIAEQQPGIRPGDASAISVNSAGDDTEMAVLVIQYRETNEQKRQEMSKRISRIIREELGIDCVVDLVAAHTLVKTSSGKLSRAGTKRDYLKRQSQNKLIKIDSIPERHSENEMPVAEIMGTGSTRAH
ncbi:MAG: fatty acyl-AMP ligase [Deltaproteobacteria bacterium]|jgi:fatty-acyl-CoA synthase|nr:fatty acyl-AMP ligase [Deltaproteobacteria bacterium]